MLWANYSSREQIQRAKIRDIQVAEGTDAIGAENRLLAWLAATGALCWLVVSVAFGVIVNNLADLRVVAFAILSVGLIIFSVKDALAKGKA